jgi:hypothetical protein
MTEEMMISPALRQKVFLNIDLAFRRETRWILARIFSVHLFASAVTLSLCPQMGWMPGLCLFACGAFLVSLGSFLAFFSVSRNEMGLLKNRGLLPAFLLIPLLLVSLSVLGIAAFRVTFHGAPPLDPMPWLSGVWISILTFNAMGYGIQKAIYRTAN